MNATPVDKWLPVASALSDFWSDGEGPSAPKIRKALGAAGVEYDDVKGSNKQDTVANALRSASPLVKRKVVTELVDLLITASYFRPGTYGYQSKKIGKFQSALQAIDATLQDDGYLHWDDPKDDGNPQINQLSSATTISLPPSTPAPAPGASHDPTEDDWGPSLGFLLTVLRELPEAAASLTRHRRTGKAKVTIHDEYDVQDFMEMALRMLYEDVRPEEYGASYAGVSSRVDFLIKQEEVLVEAKVAYNGHANKKIMEELLIDAAHYSTRPNIKDLVCVVYDLDGSMKNPKSFINDLQAHKVGTLRVHVVVARWADSDRPSVASSATIEQ